MGWRKGIWIEVYPYNGEVYVRGRTYPIKEELKKMGFRFDRDGRGKPLWWRWLDDIVELEEILEKIKPDNEEEIRKNLDEIRKKLIERALFKWEDLFDKIMENEDKRERIAEKIRSRMEIYSVSELKQRIRSSREERENFFMILADEEI